MRRLFDRLPVPAFLRRDDGAVSVEATVMMPALIVAFLAGSGTVLVHDADLRAVIDRWLSSLTPQAFEETVPLLRRTFGAFEAAERRQLGRLVAGAERETPAGFGPGATPAR